MKTTKQLKLVLASLSLGLVLTVGGASNASALASLDTGNSRTNIALRDEEVVVRGFETAFDAYQGSFTSVSGTVDEELVSERAQAVKDANAALQAKEFSPELNEDFQKAVANLKSTANIVTTTVSETAAEDYTSDAQVSQTNEELGDASKSLDTAISTLEESASNYEAGGIGGFIFLLGGIIVAVAIGITAIYATRHNKKVFAQLTANDPEAQKFTKEQKKMIVRLYNDTLQYDGALTSKNQPVLQGLELGTYKKFTALANKESYGSYAGLYYEFDSLVNVRAQNTEKAQESARRAAELRGVNGLLTQRVKALVGQDTPAPAPTPTTTPQA